MQKNYLFELCVETLEAVKTAQASGVARVELCAQLHVGGVTPALSLVRAAVQAVRMPIHILIRPREGDFVFSAQEYRLMERQIAAVGEAGAAGVVLGALTADRRIDVAGTRKLIELARPMKVTFHRAFDEAADLSEALEEVIACGADCLLTAGGAPNVLAGVDRIAQIQRQAGGRIAIMAGGGLTLSALTEVAKRTGISLFHGSLRRRDAGQGNGLPASPNYPCDMLSQDIATAHCLLEAAAALQPIR